MVKKYGTIEQMCRAVQETRRESRFNKERIEYCVHENYSDLPRLYDLCDGIRVFREEDFVPNGSRLKPRLTKSYLEVQSAVNKQLYELWMKNYIFICSSNEVSHLPLHYSITSFALNRGKPSGRALLDPSNTKYGALNCPKSRDMAMDYYGPIQHPTIVDLVRMIIKYIDKLEKELGTKVERETLCLFKHDLNGAFMLLDLHPADAHLVAAELTDKQVMVFSAGNFGLTGTPFAFDCITRTIRHMLRNPNNNFEKIHGEIDIYVDDLMGITRKIHESADTNKIFDFLTYFLGKKAVNTDKSVKGEVLDFLGYSVDIIRGQVTISVANFNKCAYHFWNVDTSKSIQVCELQRLASLGSRYSMIAREMKPVTGALYRCFAKMRDVNVYKELTPDAIAAIWLWRIVLMSLELRADLYARTFESFRPVYASVVICFDASLTGAGVVLRMCGGMTEAGEVILGEVIAVCSVVYKDMETPFQFGEDSSFQNLSEFIAVVIGIFMLIERNITNVGVHLVGDSVTALVWSESRRFRGILSRPAALVYLHISIKYGFEVTGTTHISGEDNEICDSLSRGTRAITVCQDQGYSVECVHTLSKAALKVVALGACQHTFESIDTLVSFWATVKNLI